MDASEAGWANAIDLQNVDFDRHGRVRSRMGTELFSTVAAANPYTQLVSFRGSTGGFLIASTSAATHSINSSGAVTFANAFGQFSGAAAVGTPTQTELYLAYGSLGMSVFNGSSFATPTATVDSVGALAMPKVLCLGVTPWDNRLVCANGTSATSGPGGHASSESHVHFSEPGDPQTFNSNNFEVLNPGDGEAIAAVVAWRELLFIFKRTKFYVISGTTVTGGTTGTDATLQYRAVHAGVGVDSNLSNQVVAGYDGVYFADATGIYRTTGAEPQLVSGAINPVFTGQTAAPATFFTGPSSLPTGCQMSSFGRRILATVDNGKVFVFDTDTGLWTYWAVGGMGTFQMVEHTFTTVPQLYFGATGVNKVSRFNPTATSDAGTALTTFYRSGFQTPGGPGAEATIRETLLEGAGSVVFGWGRDYGAISSTSTATVAMGAQGRAPHRKAAAGEGLSYTIADANTSAWQVNRIVPFLREVRGAAEKTT